MNGIEKQPKGEVLLLKDQICYQDGQIASKTPARNSHVRTTLFSFDKSEGISTHAAGEAAFVTCPDGVGKIPADGVDSYLHKGKSFVMPAHHPHAVAGEEWFKMLLMVVFYKFKELYRRYFCNNAAKNLLTSDNIGCIMQ